MPDDRAFHAKVNCLPSLPRGVWRSIARTIGSVVTCAAYDRRELGWQAVSQLTTGHPSRGIYRRLSRTQFAFITAGGVHEPSMIGVFGQ